MSSPPSARETVPLARGTDASDAALVSEFVQGKRDTAFVELVRRHQIPVYRKLSVELADPDDAEAVCEAVFLVASQRLAEWPEGVGFRDWLLQVADEVKQTRGGEAAAADSPRLVDPAVFFRQSVHRALHSVPEEERVILIAADLQGESIESIASSRTLSVEHVTQALENARARFTEALSRRDPEAAGEPAPAPVHPGEIIDKRYLVEELLGEGGMARVFRAEHLGIKRKVAVKTLHPKRQVQAMIRERFFREAEVLGRLAHPNFVDVSDFGESNRGMAYLVMELLSGRPLSAELHDVGRIHPARALRIVREVCSGLAFAHGLGIIHRDIKPDNVVVLDGEVREGFAKILDLGVAATGEEAESGGTTIYGTPHYMAPEQILGARIDGRVDLYATGVMLFELLTGDVPFDGATMEFVLAQQMTAEPPSLAEVAPDLPERDALQSLLDACLAKNPEKRVRTAVALRERIDAVLERFGDAGKEGVAAPSGSSRPVLPSPEERSTRRVWLLVVLVLVVANVVFWWFLR